MLIFTKIFKLQYWKCQKCSMAIHPWWQNFSIFFSQKKKHFFINNWLKKCILIDFVPSFHIKKIWIEKRKHFFCTVTQDRNWHHVVLWYEIWDENFIDLFSHESNWQFNLWMKVRTRLWLRPKADVSIKPKTL